MFTKPYKPSRPETFSVSYGVTSIQLGMSTAVLTGNSTSQTYSTPLNSLQPGTEYFYRIESRNEFDVLYTLTASFVTEDESECSLFTRPSSLNGGGKNREEKTWKTLSCDEFLGQ